MFTFQNAQEILDKAKRDLDAYRQFPSRDKIFNLFITIAHIEDYATYHKRRKDRLTNKKAIRKHFGDLYLWMNFLSNKQKHFRLDAPALQGIQAEAREIRYSGAIGGAPIGVLPIAGNDEFRLSYGGTTYELGGLAQTLISKWEEYLTPASL